MASKRVMSLVFAIAVFVMAGTANVMATFSPAPGYTATELYSSAGTYTTIGGLDIDAGKLYFGQYTDIKSLDLSDNSTQTVGTVPANAGNCLVARNSGTTYTSYGTSYSFPYPYKMGYIDANGDYVNQLDEDGIYDCAVNSSGECYIVANPDALGSKIFKYNWSDGSTTEIADIGGYSGGVAFDSLDNLYYAEQTNGEILMFTAGEVAAGGLTVDDGIPVLDITAGYIGFDADDNFYATTDWGATLARYNLDSQSKVEDIAYGGIGQFIVDGDNIYAIDTDWYAYANTIQQIKPTSLTLAVRNIEKAIASKMEAREAIGTALAKERAAREALNTLLQSSELGDLEPADIYKAKRKIRLAMMRERIAKYTLSRSVHNLEYSLAILTGLEGWSGGEGNEGVDNSYELKSADINCDGVIDSMDFAILARHWLETYEIEE